MTHVSFWLALSGLLLTTGYGVLIAWYGCGLATWRAYALYPPAMWEPPAPVLREVRSLSAPWPAAWPVRRLARYHYRARECASGTAPARAA